MSENIWYSAMAFPLAITDCYLGIGSFVFIDCVSTAKTGPKIKLWVYLCDWSLFIDGNEVANSDFKDRIGAEGVIHKLRDKTIIGAREQDDKSTLTFIMSNGYEFILDEAEDLYGKASDMLYIFEDDVCIWKFVSNAGMVDCRAASS